ncbi:unnamed protein product [Sphagnum jensenii]|uniref:Uncharacterized protein n=1 Tax=Sphagnum jensenii TaxID=128206 RepID=A0ABP0V5V8_9BRYO
MPKKPAAFKPTYKTGSGTKAGAFPVNNPVGRSTTKTTPDVTNTFPGRSNSDVANPSGLRGRESLTAYAKGRSYGE